MPSPFPGMNPYLEKPEYWSQVHKSLIVLIAQSLNPQLRPKYRVAIEERVYNATGDDSMLVGIPDDVVVQSSQSNHQDPSALVTVAAPSLKPMKIALPMTETVRERCSAVLGVPPMSDCIKKWYLEVRKVETCKVITVIEILSPKNKRSAEGRSTYETKRQKILDSLTHLVEIDLLRQGKPMAMNTQAFQSHYRIVVSRSQERPQADLYAFNLPQAIPSFPLPLQPGDREPTVNLQQLLHQLYDQGSYDLAIDYSQNPPPPLSTADVAWVKQVLIKE
ncbi:MULTISPECIES: DUF4058 family protein [unclassified Moorena]|uniref:DUF4058 family protein n=1 Tax=unclassified Moorena TaxID=2683338 RepID=UPI001401333B|nr:MULTISPECIES: DUF4058 family protein [unclassified Moorena]NEO12222.1 DUF4058 family protein [Moorena sp. SIO3E8]NEP97740.1 DUF4058 family protein [Moorena sp. SIO3F7]